ncbi:FG-GAP repeat protein [bacterium]|nr:FG-GAP repeat protein [bacterium]
MSAPTSRAAAFRQPRCRPALEWLEDRTLPAGVITGVVYQDFNANGVRDVGASLPTVSGSGTAALAVDRGLGGVAVTAVDDGGVVRGTATTVADGTYTLTAAGFGPYRIEFTGLPAGFFPGPSGPDNGSTVRFVPDGNTPDLDLGLVRPADFSPNNPDLVTSVYTFGDQLAGPNRDQPVIIGFPYTSGAAVGTPGEAPYQQPPTHALSVPANQVGTTWGLAYNPFTQTVYASAFTKKFAGYGPSGTGAIYQTGTAGNTATLFADLNQIFGPGTAGADFRGTPTWVAQGGFFTDGFNTGWDSVGKTALGGMDISADGSTLFVVNLADRNLYILPTSGPLTPATVRRVPIPNPITGATSADPDLDFRPFAVTYHDGRVYVGAVNSAESTQDRNNLSAYVLVYDPAAGVFAPAPAFQFALNYPRGVGNAFSLDAGGNSASANWLPWTPTYRNLEVTPRPGFGADPSTIYPQPWLTGLAFDAAGNLVLGLRDRTGDEVGVQTPDDPAANTDPTNPSLRRGIAVGDVLRAAFDPATGTYTLEANGTVGGATSAGAGNAEGPGGGEFYFQDFTPGPGGAIPIVHADMSTGGVLQVPGFPDVATTTINPNQELAFFSRGGVRWYGNTTGTLTRAYEAYYSGPVSLASVTFSKANGVGDLIALAGPAPVEIGNRVWLDVNRDGVQDADEPAIAGVTVRLYAPGGALLATAVTDAAGTYYFSNGPGVSTASAVYNVAGLTTNTAGFSVRLDNPADYAAGGPLFDLTATVPGRGTPTTGSDGVVFGPTDVRAAVAVGGAGQNDHTFDFGFALVAGGAVSGVKFDDRNGDGVRGAGEPGLADVTIYADVNGNGRLDPGEPTAVTDDDGLYVLVVLVDGTYQIREVVPAGFRQTTSDPAPIVLVRGAGVTDVDFGNQVDLDPLGPLSPIDFFPVPAPDLSKRGLLASTPPGLPPAPALGTGPNFAAFGAPAVRAYAFAAVAQDTGGGLVRVFDFASGNERFRFAPFGDFTGGVRVATADLTRDGVPDIVTVPGPGGGPIVRVFDGNSGAMVRNIMALAPAFRGGLFVAAADFNGDGVADVAVAPGAGGGPVVQVYDGATGGLVANFLALDETFRGGLRLAAGDVNADGRADLLVTAGEGGGPRVMGYDGRTLPGGAPARLFGDFLAFAPELRTGFWLAAGDVDADGFADVVVGAGEGGAPRVVAYSGRALVAGLGPVEIGSFFVGDPAARSGARVAATDLDADGRAELVTAGGPGSRPVAAVYDPLAGTPRDRFYAFPTDFLGGVQVG